jgi:N-acetylneuraminate synthase/N,N'-diacetyllegionaminate synthase
MSTGMCSEIEIKQALDVLVKFGLKRVYFYYYCNRISTPMKDVNLKQCWLFKKLWGTGWIFRSYWY